MSEMIERLKLHLSNTPIDELKREWEEICNDYDKDVLESEKIIRDKCFYSQYGIVRLRPISKVEIGLPVIIHDEWEDKYLTGHIKGIHEKGCYGSDKKEMYAQINRGLELNKTMNWLELWSTPSDNPNIKTLELEIFNPETKEIEYRMIDTKQWDSILKERKMDKVVRYQKNLVAYSKDWKRLNYAIEDEDKVVKTVDILEPKNLEEINPKFDNTFNELMLFERGLNLISDDGQCGVAESIIPRGKRIVKFNRDGNYFGIYEDGATRNVFNGVIEDIDTFDLIMKIVR